LDALAGALASCYFSPADWNSDLSKLKFDDNLRLLEFPEPIFTVVGAPKDEADPQWTYFEITTNSVRETGRHASSKPISEFGNPPLTSVPQVMALCGCAYVSVADNLIPEIHWNESTYLFKDAGIVVNLPLIPLLCPDRALSHIILFDMSGGVNIKPRKYLAKAFQMLFDEKLHYQSTWNYTIQPDGIDWRGELKAWENEVEEGREWKDQFSPFEKYKWIKNYARIVKLVRHNDQQIVRVYHIPVPTEDAEGWIDNGVGVSRMWSAKPEARALFRTTVEIARLVLHGMAPDIIHCQRMFDSQSKYSFSLLVDLSQSSSEDDVQIWLSASNIGIFRKFCPVFECFNGRDFLELSASQMKSFVRSSLGKSLEQNDLATVEKMWNALHPKNEVRTYVFPSFSSCLLLLVRNL
jgi:hypothetical protein